MVVIPGMLGHYTSSRSSESVGMRSAGNGSRVATLTKLLSAPCILSKFMHTTANFLRKGRQISLSICTSLQDAKAPTSVGPGLASESSRHHAMAFSLIKEKTKNLPDNDPTGSLASQLVARHRPLPGSCYCATCPCSAATCQISDIGALC